MPSKVATIAIDLRSVLFVAVGVALAFTLAAALVSQFHQVAAEDLNVQETAAVTEPNATQVLNFGPWNVALTVPLGKGLPQMSWAAEGADSVGLSAPSMEKLAGTCAARDNALGALLRLPGGSFGNYTKAGQTEVFLATLNGHDFVYQMPKTTCTGGDTAANMTAQAEAAIEGTGVLTATGR